MHGQQLTFEGENEEVACVRIHSVRESAASVLETIAALQWPGLSPAEEKWVREL